MVETGAGQQKIRLEKTDISLVFELRKEDGSPVSEEVYRRLHYSYRSRSRDKSGKPINYDYKICAEGDSWVNIYWPCSELFGYDKTFVDAIASDPRFLINNLGNPGDEFSNIVAQQQYEVSIKSQTNDFFILSGGGNDFLGGGRLKAFLKPYDGNSNEADYYIKAKNLEKNI